MESGEVRSEVGRGGSGKMPNFFILFPNCMYFYRQKFREKRESLCPQVEQTSSEGQKRRISGVFTVDILSLFALACVSNQKLKTGAFLKRIFLLSRIFLFKFKVLCI